jgi:hypothetical protein
MHGRGLLSAGGRSHRPIPPADTSPEPLYKWESRWGIQINSEKDNDETRIIDIRKFITYFCRFINLLVKFEIDTYLENLNCKRLADMYISLVDSRAKGFKKWADIHQPEKLGGARAEADEGSVIAALDLDQEVTAPAAQPHRP